MIVVAVCACCPEPRRVFLADVLVVPAGHRSPAEMLAHCPGAAVVLVTGRPGGLLAAVRDGRPDHLIELRGMPVQLAAVLVYGSWSSSARTAAARAEPGGVNSATAAW